MPNFSFTLQKPVRYVKGAGPKVSKLLENLNIKTVEDLLYFFPKDYEDRSRVTPIAKLAMQQEALLLARVVKVRAERTRRNFSLFKAVVQDGSGSVVAVWFNQSFLSRVITKGKKLFLFGKLVFNEFSGRPEFNVRAYDFDEGAGQPQLVPVYPLTAGLPQKRIRNLIKNALTAYGGLVKEFLPLSILEKFKFQSLPEVVQTLHFPEALAQVAAARERIVFDDFFVFQVGLGLRRGFLKRQRSARSFVIEKESLNRLRAGLSFTLTAAQERVLTEICADLQSGKVMHRLLQGDVGSGKTVLAVCAAFLAFGNGYQTALLAPTEILAQQHFNKIQKLLNELGVKVALLSGSLRPKEKKEIYRQLECGEINLVIGTHALLEAPVKFKALGLAIIDEQQRFGVMQRAQLTSKAEAPHVLVMTATPIPRTLALTLYGDLDKSILDELPPGRTPPKTYFVPQSKRKSFYQFIRDQVTAGRQVFVVCPLVQESEKVDLKAAQTEAAYLQSEIFCGFKVALLHGQMPAEEKDRIMQAFLANKINILVTTTVVEVGIDVPNASVMLIEQVERFGLAALHQLRGRIGRGAEQAYCFLCGLPKTPEARARLSAMLETTDGFKIAEIDLTIRGPGEVWGERQSGLPEFRLADIIKDQAALLSARDAAFGLLRDDPVLGKDENARLRQAVFSRYKKYFNLGVLN